MQQTTIRKDIKFTGIGLHSGKPVSLTLRPAEAGTGVVFNITSSCGKKTIVPKPEVVKTTSLATTLGLDSVSVATVEHLLACLSGLSIDNVNIDVNGVEIPIMDGSSALFTEKIQKVGTVELDAPRKVLRIKKTFEVRDNEKFIKAEPYNGFAVDYTIKFDHKDIGEQHFSLDLTPETFHEVANARTFGFLRDVEYLKENNLALGGSLDNAIVLDEHGVCNEGGLRYADEFVRHKILDFIGDMAMMGQPLQGRFTVSCSGHALNNKFLREINQQHTEFLEEVTLYSHSNQYYSKPADYIKLDSPKLAFAR